MSSPRSFGVSVSRWIAVVAAVLLLFSILFPPYFGTGTLLAAVRPAFIQVTHALGSSQYPDPIAALGVMAFLLLLLGPLVALPFFVFRYTRRNVYAFIVTWIIGVLLATVALPDYHGNVLEKISTVIMVGSWPSLEFYGIGYFISWIAIVIAIIAVNMTRKPGAEVSREQVTQTVARRGPILESAAVVPTGYGALDNVLLGGLPTGASIVLTGPPCDEKNLIVQRFVTTSLASNRGCVYISTSIDRVWNILTKHPKGLQVILCHPQADTIAAPFPNVARLKSVDNLTEVNLEYNKAVANLVSGMPPVVCLEILDDVLLDHHGSTRRWLMDILGRSKSSRITCLATLNPAMHSAAESQAVLETFDGHIDLYEGQIQVRPKIIQVKKLGGQKFLDSEPFVDKEKI